MCRYLGRSHGHDLLALAEPRWMWVETFGVCGNGVVEGGEECDDGSRRGGDGCDINCQASSVGG
jgi:cysteine-rich repeat protein